MYMPDHSGKFNKIYYGLHVYFCSGFSSLVMYENPELVDRVDLPIFGENIKARIV